MKKVKVATNENDLVKAFQKGYPVILGKDLQHSLDFLIDKKVSFDNKKYKKDKKFMIIDENIL